MRTRLCEDPIFWGWNIPYRDFYSNPIWSVCNICTIANLQVQFDFRFNEFVSFKKGENGIRIRMQTCKRCKCFKSCKELSKREEVQVGQFFFCFLNFTPLMIAQNCYRQYLIIKSLLHLFQVLISVKNHFLHLTIFHQALRIFDFIRRSWLVTRYFNKKSSSSCVRSFISYLAAKTLNDALDDG